MAGYGFPPFPRRVIHTSRDAGRAFAVIALGAIAFLLLPGPQCIEGGSSAGRPFPYYSACNGAMGTDPTPYNDPSALVADFVFWGLVLFGLGYTLRRRAVLARGEATPAAPQAQPPPPRPPPP